MNIQNLIRVGVAAGIGALVALFAKWGIHLPAGWVAALGVAITGVVSTLYLHVVTMLEKRWPWLSILLGTKAKPVTVTLDFKPPAPSGGVVPPDAAPKA